MAFKDKPTSSGRPSASESHQERKAMKPKTRWILRWESETGRSIDEKTSIGVSSKENSDSGGIPPSFETEEDTKKYYKGVNFYKRIGFWTANIWDSTVEPPKQIYLGSYSTITEAACAYDKASLKLYGESINHDISEYYSDIELMGTVDKTAYINIIRGQADASKSNQSGGVTSCHKGWYEVKIRRTSHPKNWQYLGRYRDQEEAYRVESEELQKSLDTKE